MQRERSHHTLVEWRPGHRDRHADSSDGGGDVQRERGRHEREEGRVRILPYYPTKHNAVATALEHESTVMAVQLKAKAARLGVALA